MKYPGSVKRRDFSSKEFIPLIVKNYDVYINISASLLV